MRQRLRIALRTLAHSPGFSVIAVLTLALGLGANASLFTILDAVVVEPLPYPRADRLVVVRHPVPGIGVGDEWGLSAAGYFHFQREARAFERLGAFNVYGLTLGGDGPPERAEAVFATASLLEVLGARPELGRLYGEDDDVPAGPAVAVLGHDFWRRRYGGDTGVIGRRIDVGGAPREIVGVLAPGIHLPDRAVDVWMPYGMDASAEPINSHYLVTYGLLREGVTAEAAEAELIRMIARFPERFPSAYPSAFIEQARFTAKVMSLRDDVIGGIRRALWVLLGAVGIVLLIACANVANLFLVRAESRRREVALRLALGATRGTLARLFFTESLVLAALAGALALGLAVLGIRVLVAFAPPALPRLSAIALDGSTIAFTALLALLSALAFGVFPLLRVRRALTPESLREGGRGMTAGREPLRARNILVVAQVALALVLLAGASLMLESFRRLRAVEPGFTASDVLTFDVMLPVFRYQDRARAATFYDQLVARLRELPGVEGVGAASALPLEDPRACFILFREESAAASGSSAGCIDLVNVAPGYFATLSIDTRGREFESTDVAARHAGVVLSRGLAERLWPGQDAIGKGIKPFNERPPFYRVIGVVDDVRADALDAAAPEIAYFPLLAAEGEPAWSLDLGFSYVLRTSRQDPRALENAVRATVASLDPTAAVANVRPLQRVVDRSMVRTSFTLMLLGIAAAIALVLGAVGIYGVISYVVGQRRAEIGVRMALGARASQVRALVLGQSLRLAGAGVALGLAGALLLTRSLRSLLFDVSASDPLVLGTVSAVLVVVALLAAAVPASRAARVDPMRTLRGE